MMKILIGTPIHIAKDYAMERWLQNVARLKYPADLFLVDNSPRLDYVEKIKGYCAKYGVTNYQIQHLDINQGLDPNIRVWTSQEAIRQEFLSGNYDAWFSWECDQLIPTNALDALVRLMETGNFMMVLHNSWARWGHAIVNANMGVTLISKQCLKKNRFLPHQWQGDKAWFKEQVLRNGGNYIDVYGIIKPIYHLNQ